MKQSVYTITIILLLCFACSPDEQTTNYHIFEELKPDTTNMTLSPDNNDNPYDEIGRIYRNNQLNALPDTSFDDMTWQELEGPNLQIVVKDLGVSHKVQSHIMDFVHTLGNIQHKEYAVLYHSMVSYEAQIMDDPVLTDFDKQVILSFTSIIRHASHPMATSESASEVEDEDWDISTPNSSVVIQSVMNHIKELYPAPLLQQNHLSKSND